MPKTSTNTPELRSPHNAHGVDTRKVQVTVKGKELLVTEYKPITNDLRRYNVTKPSGECIKHFQYITSLHDWLEKEGVDYMNLEWYWI